MYGLQLLTLEHGLKKISILLQWDSESGSQLAELMKKDVQREDFTVLGLKTNLDNIEVYLRSHGLHNQLEDLKR